MLPVYINLDASSDNIYEYLQDTLNLLQIMTPNHALISILQLLAKREREGQNDGMGQTSKRRAVQ
jgi:hypothetical protein